MNSQLSTKNSAKAVIGYYRIPSWSHNPAPELRDIKKMIPDELRMDVELPARNRQENPNETRSYNGIGLNYEIDIIEYDNL